MRTLVISMIAVLIGLTACGQKGEDKTAKSDKTDQADAISKNLPDVGKVELISVSATGIGVTPQAAVNEALKSAIVQVNGTSISSASIQTNFGLQVAQNSAESAESSFSGKAEGKLRSSQGNESVNANYSESAKASNSFSSNDSIRGQAFAEQIVQQSKGNIAEFKVISVEGPDSKTGYTVKIEAKIAKFKGPADSGKIKIVIAPLKSSKNVFSFGGEQVPSNQVLEPLRQRIIDALSQTGRFTILDRQFDSEIQGELGMIASGQTQSTDFAKLGQALSADLIWIGVVNDFTYNKHVRKLQTSDRDLISYSGGWAISQRLVNVATKQIMQSTTLEGKAPEVAPTTLGASVDKNATLAQMEADIIRQATEAILLRTFPISIVELDGNTAVLSQGGKSVTPQSRYKVFSLGKELKDPQTGQSLGRIEKYCCDVVIDRVTPTMSYGTLENLKISLEGVKADSLQIRESIPASANKKQDDSPAVANADKSVKKGSVSKSKEANPENPEQSIIKKNDW